MPNKNKIKGNNAERELCKILEGVFGQPFQRVPSSGAMLGGLNNPKAKKLSKSQKLVLSNDIIPPDCFPKLSIESKSRVEFLFHKLFFNGDCLELNEWIDQVVDSGIDMKEAFPMICLKVNNRGWYICLWEDKIKSLDLSGTSYGTYEYNNERFIFTNLKDFLNKYKDELIPLFS